MDSSKKINWSEEYLNCDISSLKLLRQKVEQNYLTEVLLGIDQFIEVLKSRLKRELVSRLRILMIHVIKWKTQPCYRSSSWVASIEEQRSQLESHLEYTTGVSKETIESIWEKSFQKAMISAENEMGEAPAIESLTWNDLFTETYRYQKNRAQT